MVLEAIVLPLHQRPMWQGRLDLNQRCASQSRMCYHYTTPLYIWFNIILLEQHTRIELMTQPWQGRVLPLN